MAHDLVTTVEQDLSKVANLVRDYIDDLIEINTAHNAVSLLQPMRYTALSSGKMVRAYLVYSFCKILNVSYVAFLKIATAVELVHCYSLIHDDLPAMDDDDLRRGKASCHKKYDEATAILAGDALQSLAFEVITSHSISDNPHSIIKLTSNLAKAIGYNGMAGGQYLDILGEDDTIDKVIHLQTLKTGKLIEYSCLAPTIISNPNKNVKIAISGFAHDIGLAYQIRDDLLDVQGSIKQTGKKVNKDSKKGKNNLVTFIGADRANRQIDILIEQAKKHLDIFGGRAKDLLILADYLLHRER
ncbi:MAG: polyprenyl synthetase family protein [Alphaproteobacteria bacterium]|nr:polyprenyl synthetase family protein [Alphaproteobacteria bacterium]